jgi:hypothetical protein
VHAPVEDMADIITNSIYEELEELFDQFLRYHMKILLGDFNAKIGREDIFKPINGNDCLHESNNDNGVRVGKFCNFEKYNCEKHNINTLRHL